MNKIMSVWSPKSLYNDLGILIVVGVLALVFTRVESIYATFSGVAVLLFTGAITDPTSSYSRYSKVFGFDLLAQGKVRNWLIKPLADTLKIKIGGVVPVGYILSGILIAPFWPASDLLAVVAVIFFAYRRPKVAVN